MSESEHVLLSAGTQINQTYKIMELVEQTENCSIYTAYDEARNKEVWLKLLESMHDISIREAFQTEAQILGRLQQPNIIKIFDFGFAESGQLFMVLEKLKGKRLSTLLSEIKHLSFERALPVLAQLCDALAAAHKAGIVARVLKPDCVFLTSGGEADFVKIIDFDRAFFLETLSGNANVATMNPGIIPDEEPCYLSPEHILARPSSRMSDIYCLGLLIYEVLCGRPAFTGKQVKTLMREHGYFAPIKIAERRPDLEFPNGLQAIVSRSLEKDPSDRYQNMDELKNALVFVIGANSAGKLDTLLSQARSYLLNLLKH